MKFLKKILYLLTSYERKRAFLLILMISMMAMLDMIGVASILPFMAVISNPDIIETNLYLNKLFLFSIEFGVENSNDFLFFLGTSVFILLIFSLSFKAITTYVQVRFTQMRQYSIAKRVVENYLHQPYSWFLNRNSADLGKTILSEVGTIVGSGIRPLLELISKGMITVAIICLLIIVDPKLAIIVGFTISGSYGLIFYFINNYLGKIGKERLKNNRLRFLAINEAFGASKEIKVGNLEQIYIKRFSDSAKTIAKIHASAAVLGQLPRFFLEGITFGGIMLITLYLMKRSGTFTSVAPIISLYVFAGYRLIPALQQVYASFSQLSYVSPSLNSLCNDLKTLEKSEIIKVQNLIPLKKSIELKNVYYSYPNQKRTAIENININIIANSTIGLVGTTGSGKSTTADLILGLLEAEKGSLEVDGQVITKKNCKAWQRSIGYVPQHIFLIDDTIAANIAFGKKTNDIDQELVERAAKIANLHEFVINKLPKKYQTTIGERGVRLSGGQRQRIGIARALYHDPQLLILDEATSSLDNDTEKSVMDAIQEIGKTKTIILIAHRLSTVKNCDKIYLMENGRIKKEGIFEDLITADYQFQKNIND
jgi:ABC-type multidrug transport system fused ATPase/permease subunit